MKVLSFVLLLTLSSVNIVHAQTNWPQWRGVDGSGVSSETSLPAEWGEAKNIRWKAPIPGRGHSSPIVGMETSQEGWLAPARLQHQGQDR